MKKVIIVLCCVAIIITFGFIFFLCSKLFGLASENFPFAPLEINYDSGIEDENMPIMSSSPTESSAIINPPSDSNTSEPSSTTEPITPNEIPKEYKIYANSQFITSVTGTLQQAIEVAKKHKLSSVKEEKKSLILWDNFPQFTVYENIDVMLEYRNYQQALDAARNFENGFIHFRGSGSVIWSSTTDSHPKEHIIANVPHILQLPELARGCEVTSLAMLLNYKGIDVSKMTLAQQIAKDNSPIYVENGKKYAGDPNIGFIGDMESFDNNGLGVYNEPIYDLLKSYIPAAINLTGTDFENLYRFIANDSPIWVITNSTFKKLPQNAFETWHTQNGAIKITYREHSVLVTGYDEDYIYFNNPLELNSNSFAKKSDFIAAWEQMGMQAVTFAK